ncbi:MAG: glycosyltransferase [Ahrensia sp.]|nr:glycosyltransferase [Ahrensia sp.]
MSTQPLPNEITIFWQNDAGQTADVAVVVVIPTFKRPDHLAITLNSVLAQETQIPFAIIVMDNHPEGSEGAAAARAVLEPLSVPATVILAHRRGNCAAYNAGFHTALSTYVNATHIAIIDDDEIARPNWLGSLMATATATGATFTGAPQYPIFDGRADTKWHNHPVFRPPYASSGPVPIIYSSGNVAIQTDLLRRHGHPWLDERFNFLGGGDSDFYARCKQQGATFAWCAEAIVDETTPTRRTELSWLNSRSLRNGSISALIQKRAAATASHTIKRWLKSLILLVASPYRSFILFVKTGSPIIALNPMNVALGRLLMEFGFANEQYKAAEKN